MNREILFKALEEDNKDLIKEEFKNFFEEKLERKIWKIYEGLEAELDLSFKKKKKDNK